jgi:hypothetical protein
MSRQPDEMFPMLTETSEVLSTLRVSLRKVFPKIKVKNDKLLAGMRGPEVVLTAWVSTKDYFLGITYEGHKLVIEPIVRGFVDPSDDVYFIERLVSRIKDLIEEYNTGKEMDYTTAEIWINSFERGMRARTKSDKLIVILRPRSEGFPRTLIDVYTASGEVDIGNLTIMFRPLKCRKGMKFTVSGELTTKRFGSILRLIRSFEH